MRAERKRETHDRILASAASLLRRRGIAGARVADVMAGADLTVGGFYAHFPTKEALVDAALARTFGDMRRRLVAGLEAKPLAERGDLVLERYLSAAHRDAVDRGCLLPAVVGEVATTAPEHARA